MRHFPLLLPASPFLFLAAARAQAPAPKPAEPFTAAGRVTTWDGQPIAGARVALAGTDGPMTDEILRSEGTVSAADGTFTITLPANATTPDAANGSARSLVIAKKGFAACLATVPEGGPSAELRTGEPFAIGDVVLVPGTRLFGRVRDAQGRPVAGAVVTARDLLGEMSGGGPAGTPSCRARTNSGGIFDLPCALPSGSALVVTADGFFVERREPVAAGAPLDIELQESGWIGGRVLADGDQGLAGARVSIVYEASEETQSVVADDAGMFRAPVVHPGRWRAHAVAESKPGAPARSGSSALGNGAAVDVRIQTEAPEVDAVERKLTVKVVTKGTGTPVKRLRALAQWGRDGGPWVYYQLAQQARQAEPVENGSVEVDGPRDEAQTGTLYVLAEGHAPLLQRDVAWSADTPALTVELEPEASISGVVRDAATGKPIADALVAVTSTSPGALMMAQWADRAETPLRTGADGAFRVGQLGAGEWDVNVFAKGRGLLPPSTVTVKTAEARTGVAFDMPAAAKVAGKLTGAPIGTGWRVVLTPLGIDPRMQQFAAPDTWSAGSSGPSGNAVGADGAFCFEGVAPGHYQVTLVLPAPPRTGAWMWLPVESLRVRTEDVVRDVDIRADRAHTLRGRITVPAAATPFENLLVQAMPEMPHEMFGNQWSGMVAARSPVGADGSFELPVMDGALRLEVFDLALGATIAKTKRVVVRGADVVHDIALLLENVTFELKASGGGAMACVERVHVQCKLAGEDDPFAEWGGMHVHDGGRGLLLPRGATTLKLALPHGDVSLRLMNHAQRLGGDDRGGPPQEPAPVGTVDVQVPEKTKGTVTIDVAPPPEVPDVIEQRPRRARR
ncbi:MAG TPA: carboxypeptidase-like regulatory domain-containing protein [Planctomycetota bacterium]|nr:carboxypeptidase-like regulatory domain-containing protein [Planctomycetota bacterium]